MINIGKCVTCKFWNKLPIADVGIGQCRRGPPSIFMSHVKSKGANTTTRWPQTTNLDWCGEYVMTVIKSDIGGPQPNVERASDLGEILEHAAAAREDLSKDTVYKDGEDWYFRFEDESISEPFNSKEEAQDTFDNYYAPKGD